MKSILSTNVTIRNNELYFGKHSCCELARKYGTPLYLMDEARIRKNCREYVKAISENFGEGSMAVYASKAASFKRIYEIVGEENLGVDVVSSGEIYTALKAGFPMEKAFFQGNNKTDEDIRYAIESGVGYFVCDGMDELKAIDRIAKEMGVKQKILLRLTPGIDPHTHTAINTGRVDSKFGIYIGNGQAELVTLLSFTMKNVSLVGYHCHVGSMVFESSVFINCAEVMLEFIEEMKYKYGFEAKILDLGGGYGVRYVADHPRMSISKNIAQVAEYIENKCKELKITRPDIIFEPGRSIVGDAGMTLYTVGTFKNIIGFKNYVSVDGGMTDNPRYALYQSPYTIVAANKPVADDYIQCDVVGRCCESGDIIQPKVTLPMTIQRGDIIAVLTTGAYNYSMASNYNRVPRPPIVMLDGEKDYVAVKRESFEDLVRNDV